MSEFQTHQPHVLREHLEEWCGGTIPPTIVTVDRNKELADVKVFDDERYVHQGVVGTPVDSVELLHAREKPIDHKIIRKYACNALASVAAHSKNDKS